MHAPTAPGRYRPATLPALAAIALLTLATATASAPGGARSGADTPREPRARIETQTRAVFEGQTVPIQILFFFDPRARVRIAPEPPALAGEGFTTLEITPRPAREEVDVDGDRYVRVRYDTAIIPVKTGPLAVGPAAMPCEIQTPRPPGQGRTPPSPDDPVNLGGFSGDDFFSNPLANAHLTRRLELRAGPVTLDVQPIPTRGRPPNFTGAVGKFSLVARADPASVAVGEPVTLTLEISGEGSFERLTQPALQHDGRWRSYPPSSRFDRSDPIGVRGIKTFDLVLAPTAVTRSLPIAEISHFDPDLRAFVTLRSPALPVSVSRPVDPAPSPADTARRLGPGDAPALTDPDVARDDILYLRTDPPRWVSSFLPPHRRPTFWWAQSIPLAVLIATIAVAALLRRAMDPAARARARDRERARQLKSALREPAIDPRSFYAAAAELVALLAGRGLAELARDPGARPSFPADLRARLARLQQLHDRSLYDRSSAQAEFQEAERAQALETLQRLQNECSRSRA